MQRRVSPAPSLESTLRIAPGGAALLRREGRQRPAGRGYLAIYNCFINTMVQVQVSRYELPCLRRCDKVYRKSRSL
jgi:hypothetical protein